jgi:hypothetical protein
MTLQLYAFEWGRLQIPRAFLLEGAKGKITVPIPSYLIVHPKGRVLFDSGLNLATQSDPESYITTAAILASVCDLMMLSVVLIPPAELWVAPALMLGASAVFGTLAAQYAVI